MFEREEDEVFRPQCRVSDDGNEIICEPILEKNEKVYKAPRKIRMRLLGQGESARLLILDDGGAPDFIIRKLEESIKNRRLD